MRLQPLGKKVVVARDKAVSETPSGIVIPQKVLDKEVPRHGTIVAVGPDVGLKYEMRNTQVSNPLHPGTERVAVGQVLNAGDRVMFNAFAGSDIELDGDRFTVMLEDDILAVILPAPKTAKVTVDDFSAAADDLKAKKRTR